MFKLKRHSQFQRVYKRGKSFRNNNLGLCLLTNGLTHNRIGLSSPSKQIPLSVNRNRCKRLLKESYRLTEHLLKLGYDIILIAKKDVSNLKADYVKTEILRLYKKGGILR